MSKWDERFSSEDYVYGTEPNEFLQKWITSHQIEGKRVLAIAEGEGRNAVWLATLGFDVEMWDSKKRSAWRLHETSPFRRSRLT